MARLRDRTLIGLGEANRAIRALLDELNARPMRHLGQSRRELFDALDRPALHPLPAQPYEFARWKKARVNIDYHVEFDGHYYSVPYTLVRKAVDLRATETTVEVFYRQERQASHPRSPARGRFHAPRAHTGTAPVPRSRRPRDAGSGTRSASAGVPPSHREYSEWSPERFRRWAEAIGPHTAALIDAALAARTHPQQA